MCRKPVLIAASTDVWTTPGAASQVPNPSSGILAPQFNFNERIFWTWESINWNLNQRVDGNIVKTGLWPLWSVVSRSVRLWRYFAHAFILARRENKSNDHSVDFSDRPLLFVFTFSLPKEHGSQDLLLPDFHWRFAWSINIICFPYILVIRYCAINEIIKGIIIFKGYSVRGYY